jgi:hypothetical protein
MPNDHVRHVCARMLMPLPMPRRALTLHQDQSAPSMMVAPLRSHYTQTTLLRIDVVAENNAAVADGPKSRYEKLENRISQFISHL